MFTNVDIFLQFCTQRVKDCYYQEWHDSVTKNRKLNLYRDLNNNIKMSPYLTVLRDKSHRSIMANIRINI